MLSHNNRKHFGVTNDVGGEIFCVLNIATSVVAIVGTLEFHTSPDIVFPAWLASPVIRLCRAALRRQRLVQLHTSVSVVLLMPPNGGPLWLGVG